MKHGTIYFSKYKSLSIKIHKMILVYFNEIHVDLHFCYKKSRLLKKFLSVFKQLTGESCKLLSTSFYPFASLFDKDFLILQIQFCCNSYINSIWRIVFCSMNVRFCPPFRVILSDYILDSCFVN